MRSQGGMIMGKNVFEALQAARKEEELAVLLSCNERSVAYGLSLTREEAQELALCRNESLKKFQRVELGKGMLDKLIDVFCDSQYLQQDNYLETLEELQEIFYEFKNLSNDKLTDDELLNFMKEQFEGVCYGDTEYLEGTCLSRFAEAIRSGYEAYEATEGRGEYENFTEEKRWDKELYMEALKDLCWR